MRWIHERFNRSSEKNGRIECERWFKTWTVRVDGYSQSGRFNIRMFKDAFRRLPPAATVKRALVLGLGGGCVVELLHDRFPGVEITVIEWDPTMVEVAERIRMYRYEHEPTILVGDALELLPTLTQTFDLIIFDLYKGEEIAPMVFLDPFLDALSHVSHPGTHLLFNAFRSKELFPILDQRFTQLDQWRFEYNVLGLFQA